ncbi:hypothetical protein LTR56_015081 [Elasticomyces elasticus]|nr:hypothetical protein LTR56_015081 [Elasticomyces elasticus]KAK3639303.1 hypothetical protein LTR22_017504 [Elasticomyces elasticus]KAK4915716.1 hypothetical protein LTR49_016200 [Elasticomyces elasticus]KAK5746067.1 hypothetical protein LTS12_022881 [Elasticomyces elasticus]
MSRPTRRGFFDLPLEVRELVYGEICSILQQADKKNSSLSGPANCCFGNSIMHLPQNSPLSSKVDYGTCRIISQDFGDELLGVWAEVTAHQVPLRLELRHEKSGNHVRFIRSSELTFGIWWNLREYFGGFEARFGRSGPAIAARVRNITLTAEYQIVLIHENPIQVLPEIRIADVARLMERLDGIHQNLRVEVQITRAERTWSVRRCVLGSNGDYQQRYSEMTWKSENGIARRTFVVAAAQHESGEEWTRVAEEWRCVSDGLVQLGKRVQRGKGLEVWECEQFGRKLESPGLP